MTTPIKQPSAVPTPKMRAVALGGAVASLGMGALAIAYPEAYSRVPPGFEGGLATVIGFVLGYLVRDKL